MGACRETRRINYYMFPTRIEIQICRLEMYKMNTAMWLLPIYGRGGGAGLWLRTERGNDELNV
jgi:hypothetical protein